MTWPWVTSAAALLLLTKFSPCHAERDGNAPWGDKSPPRGFEMWWKDPSNVLEDLEQFASLYIKVHGCVWSEYGIDNYDDDGENRDGDEEWYQGRTQPFRANAAYSLYGVLKGQVRLRKCTKATYINTFVTNMGADTILNILGRDNYANNDDDGGYGHASCYEVYDYGDNGGDRELGSGDNNNGNSVSTTMGCSLTSDDFVMATFQDAYCDGNYFLNTTDLMKDYNRAMDRVNCAKIWDYSNNFNSDASGDTLLATSSACDNNFYQSRCPDPYGKKKKYAIMVSGGKHRKWVQRAVRVLSWMILSMGLVLIAMSFYLRYRYGKRTAKRKSKSRRRKSKRGVPRIRSRSASTDTGISERSGRTGKSERSGRTGSKSERTSASGRSGRSSRRNQEGTADQGTYERDDFEEALSASSAKSPSSNYAGSSSKKKKKKKSKGSKLSKFRRHREEGYESHSSVGEIL